VQSGVTTNGERKIMYATTVDSCRRRGFERPVVLALPSPPQISEGGRKRRSLLSCGFIMVTTMAGLLCDPVHLVASAFTTAASGPNHNKPLSSISPLAIQEQRQQQQPRQVQIVLLATIERTRGAASMFSSDDDDDDEDEEEEDDEEEEQNLKIVALENGMVSKSAKTKRWKRRTANPAMQDIEFLRKRTNDLMKVTEIMLQNNGNLKEEGGEAPELSLGRQMKVDKKTFHFLLDGWAFSNQEDAPDQAKKLLSRMVDLSRINNKYHQLDMQPDVRSYTKTINAIARHASPDAGHESEAILLNLKDSYQNQPNPEAAALLKPNSYTYTAVIQAHCNSGAPNSADTAAEWIEKMVDKYQRGDDEVQPTAKAFNAILCAYGKAGLAERAQAVFDRMERLHASGMARAKPNTFHYNALISAYAAATGEGSAQRAEQVLGKMQDLYHTAKDPDVKPTTVSFNAVIDAYAKSGEDGAAQKAEQVLRRLSDYAKPNTRSFNSIINAWAKSRDADAALKSEEWLDLMEKRYEEGDLDVRPDVHSFTTVINGAFSWAIFHGDCLFFKLSHSLTVLFLRSCCLA
jgi:pentatricopeptide repeat protein